VKASPSELLSVKKTHSIDKNAFYRGAVLTAARGRSAPLAPYGSAPFAAIDGVAEIGEIRIARVGRE
jgi:hypothetical protein